LFTLSSIAKIAEFIYNLFMTGFELQHSNIISKLYSLCHVSFEKHLTSSFHLRSALWMGRSLYSRWNQVFYQVSSSGGKWVRVEIKTHQTKIIFKPRINGKMSKITKAVFYCQHHLFFSGFCDFTVHRALERLVTNPAESQ